MTESSICQHPGQCYWLVILATLTLHHGQRWLCDTGSLSRWQVSLCHDMVTPIPHNMGHMLTRPSKLQMVIGRVKLYLHSDGGTHVSTLLNRIHNNQLSPLPPLTRQTRNVLCDRCDELFHEPSFWLPGEWEHKGSECHGLVTVGDISDIFSRLF